MLLEHGHTPESSTPAPAEAAPARATCWARRVRRDAVPALWASAAGLLLAASPSSPADQVAR
jgi:hypothetical protein